MTRLFALWLGVVVVGLTASAETSSGQNPPTAHNPTEPRRVVILKVDGLNADLLYRTMRQTNPATGKSLLPWFSHIFGENGTVFENFYTRGISLSAPSWSMLDTGHHTVIRGNVEYDRYTGHVYDYLNFFPFYLGYARSREVDMPGVEVLDSAGIPLVIDAFPYAQRFQSFQLYQRGVRWSTLGQVLKRRFSSKVLFSMVENAGTPSLDELLSQQTEEELKQALKHPEIFYLDFFTGDVDHEGHATNDPAALLDALRRLDALAGRIWTAIQANQLANETLFAVVSDHGMNNVPGVFSQTFSLPDLLNSREGGAHHVITNRHQLSDYKLRGLDPLVHRVTTPSASSLYLAGEAAHYPTAWLDIDGNERASVHLRNSDLNKIHILLLQLASSNLAPNIRRATCTFLRETIDRHRAAWAETAGELDEEMRALQQAIDQRKKIVDNAVKKSTSEQRDTGEDKAQRRLADELESWEREHAEYTAYLSHLRALLAFQPDPQHPLRQKISDLVPEMALGENNNVADLEHYVVGPASGGMVVDGSGRLDEERAFIYVNYFSLLAQQRARNNPQAALSSRPIDFTAMCVRVAAHPALENGEQIYWLFADEENQLLIHARSTGEIALEPIQHLTEGVDGVKWTGQPWRAGLPLHLFEDSQLRVPGGADRASWLSSWHSEREWLEATHMCQYSNAVIGLTEELSPVSDNVPGRPGTNPILLRYERRRRELVQADLQVFAADHWNFNVRNPNPGGNHGSFLRISTHSVWMMAGSGVPIRRVEAPYDSLNFASTILALMGREPPMPDRVVSLH